MSYPFDPKSVADSPLARLFVEAPSSEYIAAELERDRARVCEHGRNPCYLRCGVELPPGPGAAWKAIPRARRLEWLEKVVTLARSGRARELGRTGGRSESPAPSGKTAPVAFDHAEIVRLRERLGWTQRKLANHIGTTIATVSRWENGNNSPRVEQLALLLTIAQGYGVPFSPFRGQVDAPLWEPWDIEATAALITAGPERILCAAIWVETHSDQPPRRSYSYPKTGLVFAGWRHGDSFTTLNAWADRLSAEEREHLGASNLAGRHQGFITSTGRFVDRKTAAEIAGAAGQISTERAACGFLTSEDLY